MKVLLLWTTLAVVLLDSYGFVLSQNNAVKSEEQLENNYSSQNIRVSVELTNSSFPSVEVAAGELCRDKFGKPKYGVFGLKTDCRKFVLCGYVEQTVVNCQAGLLFNEAKRICDWPREANCVEFKTKNQLKLVIPLTDIIW